MSARRSWAGRVALALVALLAALAALVTWLNLRDESPLDAAVTTTADATLVQRGAYLARAGNCIGCHTARGGADYAGGRGVDTPFGTVYAPNLTSDRETGIGAWTSAEFWRAMHNGRSRDGRLLYPAFPYPNFTLMTRADSDALHAFLQSLPAVRQANRAHELRFPYGLQASLAVWRALYFKPERFEPDATQSAQWNRGSYLVRGPGHCIACHASRNVLGATQGDFELGGGLIPMQNWYAPSLSAAPGAAHAEDAVREMVALLKDGVSPRASVMGPMAEVVFRSTQHLHDDDLQAMAVFLQSLPAAPAPKAAVVALDGDVMIKGKRLYGEHCASCHGEQGQGAPRAYPALAGNLAATLVSPNNLVKAILHGGFAPVTQGNPQPYGMPPFGQILAEDEVAAVATYVRQSWGNAAAPVSALDVFRAR